VKARLAAKRRADRSSRRFPLAVAVSLLAHGCMATAFCIMPTGGGHDKAAPAEYGDLDRPPVRLALVSVQPRTDPVATPDRLQSLAESLSAETEDEEPPEEEAPPSALVQAAPVPPIPPAPAAPGPPAPPAPPANAETKAGATGARPPTGEPLPPTPVAAVGTSGQAPAPALSAPPAVAKAPGPSMASGSGTVLPQATGTGPGGGKEREGGRAKGIAGGLAHGRPNGPAGETARPPRAPAVRTGADILVLPKPDYPPRSRRLGEEGLVLLEVEVLADGRAGKVRVLQAPAYPRLVDAALEAVRKATFKPATLNGVAMPSVVEVPIRFRLD